jgi:hypothetical protein
VHQEVELRSRLYRHNLTDRQVLVGSRVVVLRR